MSQAPDTTLNRIALSDMEFHLMKYVRHAAATLFLVLVSFGPIRAQDQFELGLRGNVLLGDGQPANDILGFGIIGKYYFSDGWYLAGTLDSYDYDFERPYRVVGVSQDPNVKTIDSNITSTTLGAALGRHYGDRSGFDWFWSAGIGVGFPDSGNVSGPTDTGGTFDLLVDAKTEIQIMGTLGTSYFLSDKWSFTAAARAEHHFLDISVTDLESGNTGKIDSQTPLGAYLSVNVAF